VFGKLEAGSPVADGEVSAIVLASGISTGYEFVLERTLVHVIEEVERPWPQLGNKACLFFNNVPKDGNSRKPYQCKPHTEKDPFV